MSMLSISTSSQNFKLVLNRPFTTFEKKWNVKSRNLTSGEIEMYASDFLISAARENNEGYIPKIIVMKNIKGETIHSSDYRAGEKYKDKKVLVVGSGNSGMEIAFELSNYESHRSIVFGSAVNFSISLCLIFIFIVICLHVNGTLINWKGENGLYYAGFLKSGITGISMDARAIADDIKTVRGDKI
ncbi:hypothetical protein H5410_036142 [Solanum commersonii]|uniref:Flavin-containing monooxygenase n=1 Tax=Solanum commersonii TaxID=4109 RepID=A0A9J5Y798_SOLCO|nr:hypothetical protein H5410_036142 [Solanum commersonii]